MAIDLERVAVSAIEAALEGDEPQAPRRGHTGVKAIAVGAALAAAGGLAATRGPKLSGVSGLVTLVRWARRVRKARDLPERVRGRLADSEWIAVVRGEAESPAEPEPEQDEEHTQRAGANGFGLAGGRARPGVEQLLRPQEEPPVLARAKRALGVDLSKEN